MEAGSKHGYTGIECKKERLMEEGDNADEGKEETKGGDNIFKRVKQVDVHALVGSSGGIVFAERRKRR